jgi:hypothetical protein
MAEQCEMIIGYLVPHRCDNTALGHCVRCRRGFCDEHVNLMPEGLLCQACQQGLEQPVLLPVTARNFTPEEIATFSTLSQWDEQEAEDLFSDLS